MVRVYKFMLLLLSMVAPTIVATIGVIRFYYSYRSAESAMHDFHVFIFFTFPMLSIAFLMSSFILKNKVSSGYLTSSGIIAACSVRHLSELFIGWSENTSFADTSTYLILGIGFLFLSYTLLCKGRCTG